jgi:peptide-methionine (S)-S-oxide reductase
METATFAGGCFWCTEAIFQMLKGVTSVVSGYSGGKMKNPTSDQVYAGITGHAEAIQIEFDRKKITYKELLNVFMKMHDPTSVNRQGYDVGEEYRSVIFFHDKQQEKDARTVVADLQKDYNKPIATQIVPFINFYKADDLHQNFYKKNPDKLYCTLVIDPKIQKLKKDFKQLIK